MTKFLIVTADDFGLHETVNEAVEQAHRYGVLTAASLMVAGAAADDAIRRAKYLPRLRVGLHLVLVDGRASLPYEQIPDLVDESGSMDSRMIYRSVQAFAFRQVRRQIAGEIRAQFERFKASGLALDHVNVHKHFHLNPIILAQVLRIGRDYGLNSIRWPHEPRWIARENGLAAIGGNELLRPWMAVMKRRLNRAQVFHNDTLFGIARSGAMVEPSLLQIIDRLPEGVTEMYLHPATSETSLTGSMKGYRHVEELAALLSGPVREALGVRRIPLGGFSDARARLSR